MDRVTIEKEEVQVQIHVNYQPEKGSFCICYFLILLPVGLFVIVSLIDIQHHAYLIPVLVIIDVVLLTCSVGFLVSWSFYASYKRDIIVSPTDAIYNAIYDAFGPHFKSKNKK